MRRSNRLWSVRRLSIALTVLATWYMTTVLPVLGQEPSATAPQATMAAGVGLVGGITPASPAPEGISDAPEAILTNDALEYLHLRLDPIPDGAPAPLVSKEEAVAIAQDAWTTDQQARGGRPGCGVDHGGRI